ncbi:MAG: FAD binding domain-containing protein [Pseudomonadota bacterium]
MTYAAPRNVPDALAALAAPEARILAGGTDFYPALGDRPLDFPIVDVTRIAELRGITETAEGWRVGAAVTWSDLVRADLPPLFDGLKAAAREIGAIQIQNTATLAGNLCNASPAADGVPVLLTLDAQVEIASPRGMRRLPLDAFITGVRDTALTTGEIMTAIFVPRHNTQARSAFLKLGARRYLVISIAMVAAVLEADDCGTITTARVAVGACSAVATRLAALEVALEGSRLTALSAIPRQEHLAPLAPIDDVRAPAMYRNTAALELIRRTLAVAGRSP